MKSNIIGEPLEDYVIDQIKARQSLHGSGVDKFRTFTQINVLNSPTAWMKLASSVKITKQQRLKEIGIEDDLTGLLLAKKFILSSGVSVLDNSNNLINRGGFNPLSADNDSSYTYGPYGYVPMPGLISADIKTLNRGSIKKATVKLIAQDTAQLQIIDLLYLRLGYTVLLEWGNSFYTKNGIDKHIIRDTVLEKYFYSNTDFRETNSKIEEERDFHKGNYDGFLAKVSNFSWSVNNDGSYDIELTLISLGDVVESLKTNLSPDNETVKFIKGTKPYEIVTIEPQEKNDEEAEAPTEPNQASSVINSMLYIWKWIDEVNKGVIKDPTYYGVNIYETFYGYNMANRLRDSLNDDIITYGTHQFSYLFIGEITLYWGTEQGSTGAGKKFRNPNPKDLEDWENINSSIFDLSYDGISWGTYVTYRGQHGAYTTETSLYPDQLNGGYITMYRYEIKDYSLPYNDSPQVLKHYENEIYKWGKKLFNNGGGFAEDMSKGNPNYLANSSILTTQVDKTFLTDSDDEKEKNDGVNVVSDGRFDDGAGFFYNTKGPKSKDKYDNPHYYNLYSSVIYPNGEEKKIFLNIPHDWVIGGKVKPDGFLEAIIYNTQTISKNSSERGPITNYIKEKKGKDFGPQILSNPLKDAEPQDAIKIISKNPAYYLRFGFLLKFIRENILPKIKLGKNNNPPIFDIKFDSVKDIMFSVEDHISLDPKVCIIRNDKFLTNSSGTSIKAFEGGCLIFKVADNPYSSSDPNHPKVNKDFAGYIMNIYLNFDFIEESLAEDERGDVNLFQFLSNICNGINRALGGINNLEPILDEDTNSLRIIDTTPIPGTHRDFNPKDYSLILTGYSNKKNIYESNFIRKVDLKTAITPEFATMITVGATAGGYIKGTDATAFSKWNDGLVDPYKPKLVVTKSTSSKTEKNEEEEAESNWKDKFEELRDDQKIQRFGYIQIVEESGEDPFFELKDSIIKENITIGTEYYKHYVAKTSNKENNGGGTIGFIPFKLSITMDGLSGIKIYNKLNVDTSFLPQSYGNNLDLIVTGVSHRIQNQDWETSIETTVIPKSSPNKSSRVRISSVVSNESPSNPNIGGGGGASTPTITSTECLIPGGGGYKWKQTSLETRFGIPIKYYSDGTAPLKKPIEKKRAWFYLCPKWGAANLEEIQFPWNDKGTKKFRKLRVYKDYAAKLKPLLAPGSTIDTEGWKYITQFPESLASRNSSTSTRLSNHAFGLAIDFNYNIDGFDIGEKIDPNTMQYKPTTTSSLKLISSHPKRNIVEGFIEYVAKPMGIAGIGWLWRNDAMHFSIYEGTSTYNQTTGKWS